MLEGLTVDGYSLAALGIIVVGVLALVALIRRNREVGISRYGFFVERERFDGYEDDAPTKVLWPKEGE